MYERVYDNTSKRRASCSVVRSCHVRVGHGAHAIVRNVLKVVEVVREDARSFPQPFVYRKKFVNIRCRMYPFAILVLPQVQVGATMSTHHWQDEHRSGSPNPTT